MARRDLRKMFYLNTKQAEALGLDARACVSWAIEVYYIGTGYPCGIHTVRNGKRLPIEDISDLNIDEVIAVVPGLWNKLTKAELKECDQNPVTRRSK